MVCRLLNSNAVEIKSRLFSIYTFQKYTWLLKLCLYFENLNYHVYWIFIQLTLDNKYAYRLRDLWRVFSLLMILYFMERKIYIHKHIEYVLSIERWGT